MFAVAFGHVCRLGGYAGEVFARMGRDQLLVEKDLHQRVTGMQLELFTDVVTGHGVVMVLVLDVIVDVDLDGLDVDVSVGLSW